LLLFVSAWCILLIDYLAKKPKGGMLYAYSGGR